MAVPPPHSAERLRAGLPVTHCMSYQGQQGELTAVEGTENRGPRIRL